MQITLRTMVGTEKEECAIFLSEGQTNRVAISNHSRHDNEWFKQRKISFIAVPRISGSCRALGETPEAGEVMCVACVSLPITSPRDRKVTRRDLNEESVNGGYQYVPLSAKATTTQLLRKSMLQHNTDCGRRRRTYLVSSC